MTKAVVLSPQDNVATAITDIQANTIVQINEGTVTVTQHIPFGHKFSIKTIPANAPIYKYGEIIGESTQEIGEGQHVHVHNLISRRGRGDLIREVSKHED